MNTPISKNPDIHIKFEKMKAGEVSKAKDFFKRYMNGESNHIKKRDYRYIMKDKIDVKAQKEMEELLTELRIREVVEQIIDERKNEAETVTEEAENNE